jgi:epoxyqueuosine reductase
MTPESLTSALKEEAARLGFDLAGAVAAATPPRIERFERWLADGFAGEMHYLADRAAARRHPRHVLEGVRGILMLAVNYRTDEPAAAGPGQAVISRYAWATDYHDLIRQRLHRLADHHRRLVPDARVRGVVDTAPLLERDFAELAGLGWIGKNTSLISERFGSWMFLAALLSSEELAYDEPQPHDGCGSCRACLDACPTGALVEPYRCDARRCVSYLTVELHGPIPHGLREGVGNRLFGCDACQQVCPWNDQTPVTVESGLRPEPGMNPVDLAGLMSLDEAAFRARFHHTPLWRPKLPGILRNAAVVLGNCPHPPALPALAESLDHQEPQVRAACAAALRHYPASATGETIQNRLAVETDPVVRRELDAASR